PIIVVIVIKIIFFPNGQLSYPPYSSLCRSLFYFVAQDYIRRCFLFGLLGTV
ncbi:hypothetical protein NDU88_006877, partial [Pleurodeles waltl]